MDTATKMTDRMASEEVLPEGKSGLFVLNHTGDSKFFWNKDNADEVSQAKETFAKLKAKGYTAYEINAQGDKGQVIGAFNPDAERIIMSPQMQGG